MKKTQLLNMKPLMADDKMIQVAKQQKLENRYWGSYYYSPYNTFFKAHQEDGILKVSIFFAKYLRLGATEPVYDIFLDKKEARFLTYNHVHKKWSKAKLDRLEQSECLSLRKIFCSPADTKCILEYMGNYDSVYDSIFFFQMDIREKELERKHKKVTDVWEKRMEQVPKLPKDWERWLFKVGVTQHFIFYRYERKKIKQGYCTWCEKEVEIAAPRHNKEGICPCCRHKIQFKAIGKGNKVQTKEETSYLIQRCKEGIVVREFRAAVLYLKGLYSKPIHFSRETRRIIYDRDLNATEFYYGDYKKRGRMLWIEGKLNWYACLYNMGEEPYNAGKVYGRVLPSLAKRELRYTGLYEWIKKRKFISPKYYFQELKKHPYIEKLIKAGLYDLVEELMNSYEEIEYKDGKELGKALGIDRFRMNRLRNNKGGIVYLKWLQKEKKEERIIDEAVLRWLEKEHIQPDELQFISDRMSELQIKNYVERQLQGENINVKNLLSLWKDYLSMAKRAHFNINDPIIYRAKELKKRHDEMIQIVGDKDLVLKAADIEKAFPKIDAICKEIKEKYEYQGKEYVIVAPSEIEDILMEGKALHHCIDKNDNYFERISKRESYILFLRRKKDQDVPYYTLEVEPDGTVRQKRTEFNRQHSDIKQAEKFLYRWQKQLQKKLTPEDWALAVQSRASRKRELEEMRSKKVKINGGNYAGQLLADVLEADLMEVNAA